MYVLTINIETFVLLINLKLSSCSMFAFLLTESLSFSSVKSCLWTDFVGVLILCILWTGLWAKFLVGICTLLFTNKTFSISHCNVLHRMSNILVLYFINCPLAFRSGQRRLSFSFGCSSTQCLSAILASAKVLRQYLHLLFCHYPAKYKCYNWMLSQTQIVIFSYNLRYNAVRSMSIRRIDVDLT